MEGWSSSGLAVARRIGRQTTTRFISRYSTVAKRSYWNLVDVPRGDKKGNYRCDRPPTSRLTARSSAYPPSWMDYPRGAIEH